MSLTGDLVYPNYQKDLTQPDQLHRDTHTGIAVRADASNKCAADICRSQLLRFKTSPGASAGPGQAGAGCGAAGTRRGGAPAGRHRHLGACSQGEIAVNCHCSRGIFFLLFFFFKPGEVTFDL